MTERRENILFWCFAVFLAAFLPFISRDFGITWDEWNMSNGGVLALRYLISGGANREIIDYVAGRHPQFFNSLVGIIYGISTGSLSEFIKEGLHAEKNILPYFKLSHAVNALFGVIAMVYAGRMARDIAGTRAGILTLLIMALSPRFIGDMMNNSKDIPFAGAYAASLFYMLRYLREFPKPGFVNSVGLIVSISAAIGVRVGGYLLLCYLVLFTALTWFYKEKRPATQNQWTVALASLVAICGFSYLGGLAFWPFAQVDPLRNPISVLSEQSNFEIWNGFVLYAGGHIRAADLPWHYLPVWIGVTIPILALLGFVLFAALRTREFIKSRDLSLALILFSIFFPVLFIIARGSIVYDGWRHVLFIYAPLAVLATLGWHKLFTSLKEKKLKLAALFVFLVLGVHPLLWMIRNHPNEYVYFNPLVGGIDGAFGKFETDYFGNCMRESAEWLNHYHEKNNPYKPLIVRADGHIMSTYPYLSAKFHQWYSPLGYPRNFLEIDPHRIMGFPPYLLGPKEWDYGIFYSRKWHRDVLTSNENWPPQGTLYTVKADHTVLCAVVKSPWSKLN